MSYILDALNKADEKRQGAVPNLSTRVNLPAPGPQTQPQNLRSAGMWTLLGLITVGCIAALWAMLGNVREPPFRDADAMAAAREVPKPALRPETVAPVAPAAPAMQASAVVIAAAPAAPASPAVASVRTPGASITKDDTLAQPAKPLSKAPPKPPSKAPTLPSKPQPAQAATAAPPQAPPMLSKLSDEQRRGLPALTVGGSVNSPLPQSRLLMLNGQVLREGDRVADGLTVETIGGKSSVLNWRGTRFQLPH
jgi:general secretion pathway protein B